MKLYCLVVVGIAFALAVAASDVESYRIMMYVPGSRSHKNVFDAVAEELGKRGHEVAIYTTVKEEKLVKGVKNIQIGIGDTSKEEFDINFFRGTVDDRNFLTSMLKAFEMACNTTYSDPEIQKIIKNPQDVNGKTVFDVVIVDAVFGEIALPLAHHMKVPVIFLSPSLIFPGIAWHMNIPFPYSYLSSGLDDVIHPEGLIGRAMNVFRIFGFTYFREFDLHPIWDNVIANYIPDSPSIAELERKVSFVMINWHIAIHPSAPRMPYFVDVGCLNCKQGKPLPKDLEDFMNSAVDGVIYFSLGSFTQGRHMPIEMRDKLMISFSKLKQKIIFKYETSFDGVPSNVKLVSWVPQTDLLGHPKMKLFITHGGGLSMMESAYNGCPLLAFPLSADQHGNMGFAMEKGFAEKMDWKTFTSEEFDQKLNIMLTDKRYAENVTRISQLMRDNPQDPKEKAAYWVEYVIRHKGAPHLKSGADNLNFFQYFLLDVIGALLLALIIVLYMIVIVLKAVYRLILGKKQESKRKAKTN